MRIVLSGGGTGGHIYPALALRVALLAQYPQAEFLYIGTENGLESKLVPKAGLAFQAIKIQGLRRSLSLENVRTAYYMMTSVNRSKKILKDFKPDIVVGTGGYVCAPVLYAASHMGIPTIIHEQNSVAGVTNKFLARYVDRIAICFEHARQDFAKYKHKIVFTGNPRAQEIAQIASKADLTSYGLNNDQPTLLVFGGSRGAQKINEAVLEMVPLLEERNYQCLVATGEAYYQYFKEELGNLDQFNQVSIQAYIDDMPSLMNAVDLVVCRSGATTLTEITALGLASILIPSPNVTGNHQHVNARSLSDQGAAILLDEADLTSQQLLAQIDDLMAYPDKRHQMAKKAKALGVADAGDRLVSVVAELIKSS
ncbi:UDP-N-acetylglucosamine--N-acetylmuramyl-(pentapeptide) pyrophosphoryl-undecaprenol N-acetylglucosamine transferase [Aerococcus urinaehominis]|uniref:UDP-N-acetylglucosamine--N-acetylmuramyl-(pentapeptide) pyrophosphoryl-undecaprenol N-acetylglucosamine transferase n=1 Tax=Aerococcus urinaehominis TaxID=128944 RepID=A0A0X8FLS6_9LACT|nr:undecaprenyldiphospho-muramoylpentapeptide beta-N-acetylglucosaminyltransferase [Aerococcus urinaehominis]AMB99661.1 UDP-N-acetylglucosamine--N-acetylmuramyl-(pentapeptide) pyrophosphoryl-undecaprenol N-acetylglucosamine transferase [Aerococcus urinaehominis]SDL89363.1 UDP-N-acetylglucosamine-N-acetylmuramylpentapeptide N-acetylglucosamine transferase [Aerococcus urinaehominis]